MIIFFAHLVLLKLQLNSQINIAMRKVACSALTAGMLSKKFKETVNQFIARDKAYSFMNPIDGTPVLFARSIGNGEAVRDTNILFNSFMC